MAKVFRAKAAGCIKKACRADAIYNDIRRFRGRHCCHSQHNAAGRVALYPKRKARPPTSRSRLLPVVGDTDREYGLPLTGAPLERATDRRTPMQCSRLELIVTALWFAAMPISQAVSAPAIISASDLNAACMKDAGESASCSVYIAGFSRGFYYATVGAQGRYSAC